MRYASQPRGAVSSLPSNWLLLSHVGVVHVVNGAVVEARLRLVVDVFADGLCVEVSVAKAGMCEVDGVVGVGLCVVLNVVKAAFFIAPFVMLSAAAAAGRRVTLNLPSVTLGPATGDCAVATAASGLGGTGCDA
eukprot:CAMPEP_0181224918 /NCGR_PEP_ID=MMETSP1096-20121128/31399_1 /TAXON_ID=156174 ORGANISM="Chrysochromulina ericina, Strain CCMP281" /NCGR_SAMPLE_ID=MMETSP1096 /ASSEMBLY_ACC=CAM_ASM_000453 /LENGTH=133 /DNA_ID=CAMNT_0023318065 /DNA_START=308 /DNA_END=711 /DNA_ORIENTATION=+